MNSVQVTVLLATVGLLATTNAQFGWPPPPNPPGGGSFPFPNIFNCQTFDRLFVVQGGICFQQNAVMLNCRNQTCQCVARPAQGLPTPPPGMGSPFPGFPFPFPIPTLPPIPTWNCTTSGNSTSPSTTTTTTTTTTAPPAP